MDECSALSPPKIVRFALQEKGAGDADGKGFLYEDLFEDLAQKFSKLNISKEKSLNNCQNDARKVGAFASPSRLPENEMFEDLSLLEKTFLRSFPSRSLQATSVNEDPLNISDDMNANEASNDENCNFNEKEKIKLGSSSESDDFIMKPAFAVCGADHDLGAFFKEFQSAPPLASFSGQPLAESLSDVTNQIVKYEEDMKEFDEFVDSICNMVDKQM